MKILLLASCFYLSILSAFGQWNVNGTHVNNTNTGNVGIGTSTPTFKLDVTGNLRTTSFASFREYLTVDNGGSYRVALNALSDGYITARNTSGEDKFFIATNGSSFFNGGNVGIGTSTPTFKLDVTGNLRTTSFASVREYLTVDNGGSYRVALNALSDGYITARNNSGEDKVVIATNGNSFFNGGNVGVGTDNPQNKLDIAGSANVQGGIDVNGAANFTGGKLSQHGNISNDNNAAFYNSSTEGYGLYSQGGGSGKYAFHFLNQSGNTVMYGAGNGNVGIGTHSADAKLTVKGNIHTQEVRVDLLGAVAPDYVFEETYNLQSLKEVETYIKQNKHLPEIPSAKEMEENGVNLKEMNLLLLKKIEELTLHMIELKKENEKQNEVIKTLLNK